MPRSIKDIIARVTEEYEEPIRISRACEAHVFYRVEDLMSDDFEVISELMAERTHNVCSPNKIIYLIQLPGCFTDWTKFLAEELSRIQNLEVTVISLSDLMEHEDLKDKVNGKCSILVNDIITTARSCLEAHSKVTLIGAKILCWAALIDRTFGPGPVPVVAAFTGEPVTLLK